MMEFEKHEELKNHIQRMASTGNTGSVFDWSDFIYYLNDALLANSKELESLRQYKAEAESQPVFGIYYDNGKDSEFTLDTEINELHVNGGDEATLLYARPVPAGSCAVPDELQDLLDELRLHPQHNDGGDVVSYRVSRHTVRDLISMLSAIPSNSEGEKS